MGNFQTYQIGALTYTDEIVFLNGVAYATPDYVEKLQSKPALPIIIKFQVDSGSYSIGEKIFEMNTSPTILNYRIFLPARYLVEPLDGSVAVEYFNKDETITCRLAYSGSMDSNEQYKESIIEMRSNIPKAKVNGKEVQIDPNNPKITPIILNGRTMVPLRFLAESLGCEVKWITENKTILITYKP